jgi:hypothetical protein
MTTKEHLTTPKQGETSMRTYTPIAVAGAIAAAVVMTAATSTDANANTPGCRHRVNPYVACTDRFRIKTMAPVRMQFFGAHRGGSLHFRRR